MNTDSTIQNEKTYGSFNTSEYDKSSSLSQFIEAAMAEKLLEEEPLNLSIIDSLLHVNFPYASEFSVYSLKMKKGQETTNLLYYGKNVEKQLNDTTKGAFIAIPLGTSGTHLFVSRFVFKPSIITRRLTALIVMSGIAVIAVAILLFVLLFQLKRQIVRLQVHEKRVRGIVHDLKSPLAYVYSMLGLFELSEPTSEQLVIGKSRVKRLSGNIERMLEEIQFNEKKHATLQRKPYNLEQHCSEIAEDLQLIYKEKSIRVIYALSPEAQTICADAFYFDSCLRNLLDNAIKYSGESPIITVTSKREKNKIFIAIADNGVGIAKKEQQLVFTSFFRSAQHALVAGHGLGLQSVQQIVKAHGGKITLISKIGNGSIFTICIPDR
ncbi:MAG: HAMP domain-containing sensor histidine kinase [Bacteroidia bacterium]|nr:HAMP domain-containing sensor histidine kinase [Bacteroidia bacterium]